MGWWMVLYWIATIALTAYSLRSPKTQAPSPSTLEEFDVPQAKNGALIPVAFGTVDIAAPNVLWYGDLLTEPVKQKGGK